MSTTTPRLPFALRHGYGMAALSIAVANTAILFFLLKFLIDEVGLAPGVAGTVLAVAALAGVGVAAAHVLPWSMLPDVIEADKAETGQDRAGAFYGVMTFLEKGTTAVALFVLGQVLGLAGYVEGAATQPESARLAILALVGPLPGVVLLAAAIFAWKRPPLTRDDHRRLLARLAPQEPSPATAG